MDGRDETQIGWFEGAGNFLVQLLAMVCIAVVYGGYAAKKPCRSRGTEVKPRWWGIKHWGHF